MRKSLRFYLVAASNWAASFHGGQVHWKNHLGSQDHVLLQAKETGILYT